MLSVTCDTALALADASTCCPGSNTSLPVNKVAASLPGISNPVAKEVTLPPDCTNMLAEIVLAVKLLICAISTMPVYPKGAV